MNILSTHNRKTIFYIIGSIVVIVVIGFISWYFLRSNFGTLGVKIIIRPENLKDRVEGSIIVFKASPIGESDLSKVKEFKWDLGDGTTKAGQTLRHVYKSAGDYSIKLTIDGNTQLQDVITILPASSVELPSPPPDSKPTIVAPKIGYVNEPITFSETSNTGSVWRWDMGDGQNINSVKTLKYKFKTTGRRTIRVFVDGNNNQYGEHTIDIRDKTRPQSPNSSNAQPRINKAQFKNMLKQYASKSISSSDFEHYLNPNGGFGINSNISVDGNELVFSSYLRSLRITGKTGDESVDLEFDNEGYLRYIKINTQKK